LVNHPKQRLKAQSTDLPQGGAQSRSLSLALLGAGIFNDWLSQDTGRGLIAHCCEDHEHQISHENQQLQPDAVAGVIDPDAG
jgi:hypothetical protein